MLERRRRRLPIQPTTALLVNQVKERLSKTLMVRATAATDTGIQLVAIVTATPRREMVGAATQQVGRDFSNLGFGLGNDL